MTTFARYRFPPPPHKPIYYPFLRRPEPTVPVITQAMLTEYRRLKHEAENLEQQRGDLHRKLLTLAETGATIEPGAMDLKIDQDERRILCFDNLAEVLGDQYAAEVRGQIKPVVTTSISVIERATA